ncbi:MAG: hypothetical protein M0Z94_01090 [Dehalococcoidales bacterium]|nr:hypothetical protein [Dehalococcoidales bacterium]
MKQPWDVAGIPLETQQAGDALMPCALARRRIYVNGCTENVAKTIQRLTADAQSWGETAPGDDETKPVLRFLGPAKPPRYGSPNGEPLMLDMHAAVWANASPGTTLPFLETNEQLPAVRFSLYRVGGERTEIEMTYRPGAVGKYVKALVESLCHRYPQLEETRKTGDEQDAKPTPTRRAAQQHGGPTISGGCMRWRQDVQRYLQQLPQAEDPTLDGLCKMLFVTHDYVRQLSSQHKDCCFDWLDVKRSRKVPQ